MSEDQIKDLVSEVMYTRHLAFDLFNFIIERTDKYECYQDTQFQELRERMIHFGFIGEGEANGE